MKHLSKTSLRVCAVCGKTVLRNGETTFGFKAALQMMGFANWKHDKAHPSCVRKLARDTARS